MNKYQRAGYKGRFDFLQAFRKYMRPYLMLTLPEEWSLKEKRKEIRKIKRALLKEDLAA